MKVASNQPISRIDFRVIFQTTKWLMGYVNRCFTLIVELEGLQTLGL